MLSLFLFFLSLAFCALPRHLLFLPCLKFSNWRYIFPKAQSTNLSSLIFADHGAPIPSAKKSFDSQMYYMLSSSWGFISFFFFMTALASCSPQLEFLSSFTMEILIYCSWPESRVMSSVKLFLTSPVRVTSPLFFFFHYIYYCSSYYIYNYWVICLCPAAPRPPWGEHLERKDYWFCAVYYSSQNYSSWHLSGS